MPSIIPAEGDNLTHSTGQSHRSDNDGSLSPHFVNRYSVGKGGKKRNGIKKIKSRKFDNNDDLRLSKESTVLGLKEPSPEPGAKQQDHLKI